jgi:DNA-binding transcriptional LysR family regulator
MDQLGAMRIFIAVVDSQGFSAASRMLGIPVPTVCRKVAHLEERLGVQLLTRSTRKTTVTDSGHQYYENVRRILEDIDSAERLASGEYKQVKGLLTITAPSLFARLHVLPIVNDFLEMHDNVEVRLLFTNHVLDMLDEHIDLGIRIGQPSSSEMTNSLVGKMRAVVCASPAYLSANGRPLAPDDIIQHH